MDSKITFPYVPSGGTIKHGRLGGIFRNCLGSLIGKSYCCPSLLNGASEDKLPVRSQCYNHISEVFIGVDILDYGGQRGLPPEYGETDKDRSAA